MAKKTGHTNAGVQHAAGLPSAPLWSRMLCWLAVIAVGSVVTSVDSSAGKPSIKSRYRSASHGNTSVDTDATEANRANSDADKTDATGRGNGVFGLRSLLGGKRSGKASREDELLSALPMDRLTPLAQQKLGEITDKPTLYRRLPTQSIRCDEELFLFLTRKPEAIIGIWDLMGITKVQATRIGPYKMDAVDGSGTSCQIDLLYGDRNLHVFMADGMYDGKFTQKPIRGKGVFVFKSTYVLSANGSTTVIGTLDTYIKFESLGADFLARSLGGLIGRSADHNFVETAKFITQISRACETNPDGMLEMIDRMPQVSAQTKTEFARVVMSVSRRHMARALPAAKLVRERGITETTR